MGVWVEVDFLVGLAGRFAELARRATTIELDGRKYRVVDIDDLIAMKLEAGRPQDRLDVETLRDLKKRTRPDDA